MPKKEDDLNNVFESAIKYMISKKETRWIYGVWFLQDTHVFYQNFSKKKAQLMADSLFFLREIQHHAEMILKQIAKHYPQIVWDYFEKRLLMKLDGNFFYGAIPYQLNVLKDELTKDISLAIGNVRKWYRTDDDMFQFGGARMLKVLFPVFTDELAIKLSDMVSNGTDDDLLFCLRVLSNYRGEVAAHVVFKRLIEKLPIGDERYEILEKAIINMGVVSGEFGVVTALQQKRKEINLWLADSNEKIQQFAVNFIRKIDSKIAYEQKMTERRKAFRKLDWLSQ